MVDGPRAGGRPLSARAAWRELFGESDPPEVNVAVLRTRHRRRARRIVFDSPDVAAAVDDPVVVVGGWAAAMWHDRWLDEDVEQLEVLYVGDDRAARLDAAPERVVPARVAAVDLAERGGARVLDAALGLWQR